MYAVEGVVCDSCVAAVVENVHSLSGVSVVTMDLVTGGRSPLLVTSGTKLGAEAVRDAVEQVGFDVPRRRSRDDEDATLVEGSGAVAPASSVSDKVTDHVCGMNVDPATAVASIEHEGRMHHFCGKGCAEAFLANPARYTEATAS